MRVLEVVQLFFVELNDRSVGNDNPGPIFAVIPTGHNPLEELGRVFELALEPIRQGLDCMAALPCNLAQSV